MPRGGVVTAADVERKLAALAWYERRRPRPKYSAELARLKNLPAPRNVPTRYAPIAPADARASFSTTRCDGDTAPEAENDTEIALNRSNSFYVNRSETVRQRRSFQTCAAQAREPLRSLFGTSAEQFLFEPYIIFNTALGQFIIAAVQLDFSGDDVVQTLAVAVSTDASGRDWTTFDIDSCVSDPEFSFETNPRVASGGDRTVITLVQRDHMTGEATGGSVVSTDGSTAACTLVPIPLSPTNELLPSNGTHDRVRFNGGYFGTFDRIAGTANIRRYELTLGNRPSQDRLRRKTTITIPAWRPPPDARQPNGQRLETGDGSFTAPAVGIGNRFWLIHTVNDGGFARPRIYEFSDTGTTPLAVYQLSSVPEQNDHLFNVSIAVNGAGANGIAFVNATRTVPTGGGRGRPAMVVLSGPHASATGWERRGPDLAGVIQPYRHQRHLQYQLRARVPLGQPVLDPDRSPEQKPRLGHQQAGHRWHHRRRRLPLELEDVDRRGVAKAVARLHPLLPSRPGRSWRR